MKYALTAFLGLLFAVSPAYAYDTPQGYVGDFDCSHPGQGLTEECIDRVIRMPHLTAEPIGHVAYNQRACTYLIIKEHNDEGTFVIAEFLRSNNDPKPHRGWEIHKRYWGIDRTFEAETKLKYRIGYEDSELAVEKVGLTASDAVTEYVKACARK